MVNFVEMEYPCGVSNLNFVIIVDFAGSLPVATLSFPLINTQLTSILPSLLSPLYEKFTHHSLVPAL